MLAMFGRRCGGTVDSTFGNDPLKGALCMSTVGKKISSGMWGFTCITCRPVSMDKVPCSNQCASLWVNEPGVAFSAMTYATKSRVTTLT